MPTKIDNKVLESIIDLAKKYMRMKPNALHVEAAFGRATNEVLGERSKEWGKYKKKAQEIYKDRQEKLAEFSGSKAALRAGNFFIFAGV